MADDSSRDLSRVWLATSILGLASGGVLWLLDLHDAANVVWAVTTVVALLTCSVTSWPGSSDASPVWT